MKEKELYIIDFDSTFTQVEALDELAKISLKDHPDRKKIYEQIEALTNASMEGKLSFAQSLAQRVKLLQANKTHLKQLIKELKKQVSTSFARNKAFFKSHQNAVYIVSGGFKEFIIPVVSPYHIKEENIYANTFEFDTDGNIIGYDVNNPLSEEAGKVKLLRKLNFKGTLYGIGDGYSDYQLRESGLIKRFFAFTENIERASVLAKADHITPSFDEFLYINNLPRAISYPKSRIKCLVLGEVDKKITKILKNEGYDIRHVSNLQDKYIKAAGIMICDAQTLLTDEDLKKAEKLKVIGYLGKCNGQLNVKIANDKGIVVFDDVKNNARNGTVIAQRVIDFINKGDTIGSFNFPNIQLPRIENGHRLIHIHQNLPGIMAEINAVFAKFQTNILAQFLMTKGDFGYVITDVDAAYDQQLIKSLKKIGRTIKFRILY